MDSAALLADANLLQALREHAVWQRLCEPVCQRLECQTYGWFTSFRSPVGPAQECGERLQPIFQAGLRELA